MIKKHTPIPWRIENSESGQMIVGERYIAKINKWHHVGVDPRYQEIEDNLKMESEANAELIVRAVNSHEALRTQAVRLEGMLAAIQHGRFKPTPENVKWYREEALKAIQQAEGK